MDDEDTYERDYLQEGMDILRTLAGEKTLVMVREPVPEDSVGITIVFGGHQTHATLRGEEHKEFLLHLTDVLEAERIAIAQQKGSEEE